MADRPRPGTGADRGRRQGPQAADHLVHRLRDERDHGGWPSRRGTLGGSRCSRRWVPRCCARSRTARSAAYRPEASQCERYAAVTQPEAPQRLGALTAAQAEAEFIQATDTDLSDPALPDLIAPATSRARWRTPVSLAALIS
ncbi:hypothetical protein GCM10010521_17210 [Streptomyces rameus]|uniref:Uncharacterized protein n=1 Tax=Streptomyces rameus TaxID=68261 RepID=A0ABP6N2R8_9ACTN